MLSRKPIPERIDLLRRFADNLGLGGIIDKKLGHRGEALFLVPNVRILVHEGEGGPILDEILIHNLVVDTGLDNHRNLIGYPSNNIPTFAATPQYYAIGTDSSAAAAGQTALGAEVLREEITRRYPGTHSIDFYYYLSTSSANSNTLTETGIFSVPAGGEMWARATHTAITKTAAISVSYRWTWTYGAI